MDRRILTRRKAVNDRLLFLLTKEEILKRSVIKYSKTRDGKIKLVSFTNVASSAKLNKEVGKEIVDLYLSQSPWFMRVDNKTITINGTDYKIGQTIEKQDFEWILSNMKQAGNRLLELKEFQKQV